MAEHAPDHIELLPGDGIGRDMIDAAKRLIDRFDGITTNEQPFGHESIEENGEPLTAEVLAACRAADAVLLGSVGTPPDVAEQRRQEGRENGPTAEQGLLDLRRDMQRFANLRPMEDYVRPSDRPPVDLLLVRELLGGEYRGDGYRTEQLAVDVVRYARWEVERVAHAAFQVAEDRGRERGTEPRVVSGDKSNVMFTGKLWREVVSEVSRQYPDVRLEHLLVDNLGMHLAAHPEQFDVILVSNLPGDILSDVSAGRVHGSLGLAPSASKGERSERGTNIFESVHGAAFDIAGKGEANPLATFLSLELLLRDLDRSEDADDLRAAVVDVLHSRYRTADMTPRGEHAFEVVSTNEITDIVSDSLAARLAKRQATSAG